MLPLFLGITAVNILLLAGVFGLGLEATDAQSGPSGLYALHITLGITSGLVCALTHTAVYTYFMATSRWLQAAADKADLDPAWFVAGALARKTRALFVALAAILLTGAAIFAGAGSDPTMNQLWPPAVHRLLAAAALAVNLASAWIEFGLIADQGRRMDKVLTILNAAPGVEIEKTAAP